MGVSVQHVDPSEHIAEGVLRLFADDFVCRYVVHSIWSDKVLISLTFYCFEISLLFAICVSRIVPINKFDRYISKIMQRRGSKRTLITQ